MTRTHRKPPFQDLLKIPECHNAVIIIQHHIYIVSVSRDNIVSQSYIGSVPFINPVNKAVFLFDQFMMYHSQSNVIQQRETDGKCY